MYSVSQKSTPLKFSDIFPKRLGIFSPNFTHLLYVGCADGGSADVASGLGLGLALRLGLGKN